MAVTCQPRAHLTITRLPAYAPHAHLPHRQEHTDRHHPQPTTTFALQAVAVHALQAAVQVRQAVTHVLLHLHRQAPTALPHHRQAVAVYAPQVALFQAVVVHRVDQEVDADNWTV